MRESLDSGRPHAGITVIAALLLGVVVAALFQFFVAVKQASFEGWDSYGVQFVTVVTAIFIVPVALLVSLLAVWLAGEASRNKPPVHFGLVYGSIVTSAALVGALVLGLGVSTVVLVAATMLVSVGGGWIARRAAVAIGRL